MSVEDRLLVLISQARQAGGDAALHDTAGLRSRLSRQAPDLHGEIQALAAALAMGAPGRIAAAADADAERVVIAAQIARQERLSMSVVEPGLTAACVGGAGLAPTPGGDAWAGDSIVVGAGGGPAPGAPAQDSWAGDSVVVGTPQPAPPPFAAPPPIASPPPFAPQSAAPYPGQGQQGAGGYPPASGPYAAPAPFYTKTWFFASIALLIVAAAIGYTVWRNWGAAAPAGQPAVAQPGPGPGPVTPGPQPPVTPPPAVAAGPQPGGPTLAALGQPLVSLPKQVLADGRVGIGFRVSAPSGPIDGIIILPRGGWDGETMVLARNGAGAQAIGSGRLVLQPGGQDTISRSMRVQWQQDGVGAGQTEIAFASGSEQADVVLSGAAMCIGDPQSGEVIGCGQVE